MQRPLQGTSLFVNTVVEAEVNRIDDTWGILESLRVLGTYGAGATPAEVAALPVLHKGYCDTHLHAVWMAAQAGRIALESCLSLDSVVAALAAAAPAVAGLADPLQAYGWDHERYQVSPETFARAVLEFCQSRGLELVAFRVCGHMAVVTPGLAAAWGLGIHPVLRDRELDAVHEKLFRWDENTSAQLFLQSQDRLLQKGFTAIGEMSVHNGPLAGLRKVAREGHLKIDVQAVLDHEVDAAVIQRGPFSERNLSVVGPLGRPAELQVRHLKRFLDGSLGARTAWLRQPYDDEESFGDLLYPDHELFTWAASVMTQGWLLAFHAIGDGALEQLYRMSLSLREPMQQAVRPELSNYFALPAWHRIEHAQVMGDDLLHLLLGLNCWSFLLQPYHRVADQDFVIKRLGPTRFYNEGYRLGSLAASPTARLGLGSDAPIASWDPRQVLEAAQTHPNPRERVDRLTALWHYTTGAKLALGLHPGSLASGSTVVVSTP